MSLGLLGDYGSDSEEESHERTKEEGEREGGDTSLGSHVKPPETTDTDSHDLSKTGRGEEVDEERQEKMGSSTASVTSFGLSGEGDTLDTDTSDSDSSREDEEGEGGGSGGEIAREQSPLPLPVLDGSDRLASSVFSNPYQEAEEAKLAVLTQHVGLSNVEPKSKKKVGRKRPRGHGRGGRQRERHSQFRSESDGGGGDSYWTDGDAPVGMGGGRGRKQRSGVGESLQPPKKYMKIHQKIRSKEQPWTTQ